MIKEIIKRDGTTEPFLADKVNGWGKWAAESIGEDRVDWHSVVSEAMAGLPEKVTSQELQESLIKACLEQDSWPYYRMAGRLYVTFMRKQIFGTITPPALLDVHKAMWDANVAVPIQPAYSEEDYAIIEDMIDHELDYKFAHFQVEQLRQKYSIRDRVSGREFESPQMVYMRMAMALCASDENRMETIKAFYEDLNSQALSAPTPNYTNLGSNQHSYASCCTYVAGDDKDSLMAADHIGGKMTLASAGIGSLIETRSKGDPVAGGAIKHLGRRGYLAVQQAVILSNIRNGRNGAGTTYYSIYDPDAHEFTVMRHPLTPSDKRLGSLDFCAQVNKHFMRKVANNEDIFTFNCYTAPDLHKLMYSDADEEFTALYEKYEADENFKKNYVSARERFLLIKKTELETGRHFTNWVDEMNRHTSFKETIHTSNLCMEAMFPNAPYQNTEELYLSDDSAQGEIGLCNLAAVVISNIRDDDHYRQVVYNALKMIDYCIHKSEYSIPHLGYTAKQRLNAGIGIMDLAHYMARKGLMYDSPEGKAEMHRVAERHMFICIEQSLRLAKERGVAPWMNRTKWVDGWMPIDTYAKGVDEITDEPLHYDWEALRAAVVENGGIRNSCLVNYMPGESSSKACGATNSIYPIRRLAMGKTDQDTAIHWAAPDSDLLDGHYQISYTIDWKDQVDMYAIFQKFTDQGISADMYRRVGENEKVGSTELIEQGLYMTRMGMKSRYYQNTQVANNAQLVDTSIDVKSNVKPLIPNISLTADDTDTEVIEEYAEMALSADCAGGSCSL